MPWKSNSSVFQVLEIFSMKQYKKDHSSDVSPRQADKGKKGRKSATEKVAYVYMYVCR